MKFTVNTIDLNEGLSVAIRALSQNKLMPILDGIYVRAEGSELMLVCTDLSLRIEVIIPAEVTEEGSVVIPGKLFSDISRKLPGESITFSTQKNSQELSCK